MYDAVMPNIDWVPDIMAVRGTVGLNLCAGQFITLSLTIEAVGALCLLREYYRCSKSSGWMVEVVEVDARLAYP